MEKRADTKATWTINTVYSNHLKVWFMFALISGAGRNLALGVDVTERWKKKETGDVYIMYEMIGFIAFSYFSVCMRHMYLNWFKYLCVILVKICFINV